MSLIALSTVGSAIAPISVKSAELQSPFNARAIATKVTRNITDRHRYIFPIGYCVSALT